MSEDEMQVPDPRPRPRAIQSLLVAMVTIPLILWATVLAPARPWAARNTLPAADSVPTCSQRIQKPQVPAAAISSHPQAEITLRNQFKISLRDQFKQDKWGPCPTLIWT
jgi:hypothetical protein